MFLNGIEGAYALHRVAAKSTRPTASKHRVGGSFSARVFPAKGSNSGGSR